MGFRCVGSKVVVHGLSCSGAGGIFPDQGIKPVSPALQGRSFTTGPQESPSFKLFLSHFIHGHGLSVPAGQCTVFVSVTFLSQLSLDIHL